MTQPDNLLAEARRLIDERAAKDGLVIWDECEAVYNLAAEVVAQALKRAEDAERALRKIDAIRNSIIGCQGVNWSEHIYPLVAALNEAGYPGEEYEKARDDLGTLIEQTKAAEAQRDALTHRNERLAAALEVGERFLDKCNSAWAAGEPSHRVRDMLNQADKFRDALSALNEATPHG